MKVIYRKSDSASVSDTTYSFVVYYDDKSEHECKRILESNKAYNSDSFRSHVLIDIEDSIIHLSVRYMYFREFFDAFLNGAIVIEYHGYAVTPVLSTLTLTDHRNSHNGKDCIFTQLKFKAGFEFQ